MSLQVLLEEHRGWDRQAACRGDFRFTADAPSAELKQVCARCPVRASCLACALVHEERHDVWGGLDFAERGAYCPVCGGEKAPDALGCTPAHSLIRLVRLIELERAGDPDVRVSAKQTPSARTAEDCPVPLGQDHSSPSAYKRLGCRCPASRRALLDQRAARKRIA